MTEFKWAKLPDDTWAVSVWDGPQDLENQIVQVTAKSGKSKLVALGLRISVDGKKQLYAVQQDEKKESAAVTEVGVYENPINGCIYVVKPNREKTHLYAKRLIEINAERATEADERVQIEFEYDAGAIYKLTPDMKMDFERARALTIRYGRCIVCGAWLRAAESVERGIGPVCIKSFRSAVAA